MPIPNIQVEPLQIPIIITHKNNKPYLELRTGTNNVDILKSIVSAAFHERPIIVMPIFTDKLRSLSSMIEKGIIYRENEQYYFTF